MRGWKTNATRRDRWKEVGLLALIAAAYFLSAEAGLRLALVGDVVTPLWPPTGVAVVAYFALGRRVWPAVALGALATNFSEGTVDAAVVIAVGNTVAPLAAATLLHRVGFRSALDRVRDVIWLIFGAALGAMLLSATWGTASLWVTNEIERRDLLETWSVWWAGDAMGVLFVAPFLWWAVSLRHATSWRPLNWPRIFEAVFLFALLGVACTFAVTAEVRFLTLPILGAIAWRFQQRGAAPSALLVSVVMTWAAAQDRGPFEGDSLLRKMVVLQTFNAAIAFTSYLFAAAVTERNRDAERQTRVAETLQRSLLPEQLPDTPDVGVAVRYIPATSEVAVGGDWYDIISLPEGQIGLVIGDVAGHGVESAATMGQIRMALRAYAMEDLAPAAALARLNRVIRELNPNTMATVLYAHFSPLTGEFRFASAGHLPPLLADRYGDARYIEGGRSVPLGVTGTADFREAVVTVRPDETLVLYTDGLIEQRTTPLDDRLNLLADIARNATGDVEEVCDEIIDALLPHGPIDDVAVLAIRPAVLASPRLYLRSPAIPASVPSTRHAIAQWLLKNGVSSDRAFDVLVAASEACANAVQHAYGIEEGTLEVEGEIDENELTIVVRDRGRWRDPEPRTPESYGGHGVMMMRALIDSVDVAATANGTQVRLRHRRTAPPVTAAGD